MSEREDPEPEQGPLDFGPGERNEDPARRWAHRLDPDLAAERAGQGSAAPEVPPPARPPGASRYGWFVGVVAVLILAYISVNTLSNSGVSHGVPAGQPLPPFAVPLALGDLSGDANLATRDGNGAGKSGRTPACSVADPRALNLCRVAGSDPLVLIFFSIEDSRSVSQIDVAQRVAARLPGVRFAAIALRGDRKSLRSLIVRHGWTLPVGYDRNGDIAARYGVPTVPTLAFAYAGRIAMGTTFHFIDEARLQPMAAALQRRPAPAAR